MPLTDLTAHEQHVVLECLKASAEGPFFPDDEFRTIFGLRREDVQAVVARWPFDDREDRDARLAINNAMNNLLGYPHRQEDVWEDYISVPPQDVKRIFDKWRGERVDNYFDGMM